MPSTKEIQLDHNQIPTTDNNPKYKVNVVLDQSLSKTRQSKKKWRKLPLSSSNSPSNANQL